MKRWRSIVQVLPLVLCLTLDVSGCANRQPETARYAPEEDRRLVVYTSHKEEVYWPIVREFEDRTGIWVEVVAGGTNELLARRFNGMVGALKRNQEQLVENQRELNQAQIRMLQAQLNPHFLCNTLDTMKWIGKIHQVPQVALMAANLGDILRFCISREEFVPISREVEILRRYMEIQSIRLSGRCSLTVELPEEMEGLLVPRMILQPIVENAVLHGLPGVENGVVQVKVWKEGDRMKITVTDNGRGLPEEWVGPYTRPGTETGGHHLGLYNVDSILKKYYGEEFGLSLDRRPDGPGTVVTAVLLCKEEPVC